MGNPAIIADSTNSSDAERKKLEIERVKLHYAELLRLATENGMSTAALLIAQGEEIALIDPNVEGEQIIAIQKVDKIEKLTEEEINNIVEKISDFGSPDFGSIGSPKFIVVC